MGIIYKKTYIRDRVFVHDDEYYYNLIRKNLKKFRKEKNLTQQNLADMADISREYLCDIENESRGKHVTIAILGRIADAMEIDIKKFFNK